MNVAKTYEAPSPTFPGNDDGGSPKSFSLILSN